jgi:hypothetical protein
LPGLFLAVLLAASSGCSSSANRYLLIDQSLQAGDFSRAALIVEQREQDYGGKSRVLYDMDRGLTLHLAGRYSESSQALERAEAEVDRLYTKSLRTESAAFLTNDTVLFYEGEPYEHVLINVVKALNYAAQGQLQEALVEARRIDHRLNVLSDQARSTGSYRNDGFARYLSGILYEAAGDLNNAFIAYRNAYEAYESGRGWSRVAPPSALRPDLLRTAEALHLTAELEHYRRLFPDVAWEPSTRDPPLAQVVMISYNGRAPRKEDRYLDVPISLDALQLVLLNRAISPSGQRNRAADSVLYGLNGRVVRVALPQLIAQKTRVPFETMTLTDLAGNRLQVRSESVQDVTALAEKSLSERLPAITTKAVARAATKFAMAEAATRGAQGAAGKDAPWVGLLVGLITHGFAVASEEADKRSWQTLPDEIHMARVWVPAGTYRVTVSPSGPRHDTGQTDQLMSLAPGQTVFLMQRVMQ